MAGIPLDWASFGAMLADDQHSGNAQVRESAARVLDTMLDYISAKISAGRVVV